MSSVLNSGASASPLARVPDQIVPRLMNAGVAAYLIVVGLLVLLGGLNLR